MFESGGVPVKGESSSKKHPRADLREFPLGLRRDARGHKPRSALQARAPQRDPVLLLLGREGTSRQNRARLADGFGIPPERVAGCLTIGEEYERELTGT